MNSRYALNLPVIATCLEARSFTGASQQSPDVFF